MKEAVGVLLGAIFVIAVVAGVFVIVAGILMLLMNAAFPLLVFGYGQALALAGIAFLIGLPAMRS